jgi:hypothetical protein
VLLRRNLTGEVNLLRRRDLSAFIACCLLAGPIVGGVIGGTTVNLGAGRDWLESFLSFLAGDAMGVLTVGGAVLVWRHRPRATARSTVRWALALLATAAVTVVGFWPINVPLYYLPIPLLFWFAFSQRLTVMVTSALVATVAANWMVSSGRGPWADLASTPSLKTATLQLFLGIAILGAWLLAVGVAERDQALRQARLYEREVDAAHRLQRALLPVLTGGLSGVHITADYRPADLTQDVGGDWYDVFALRGGRIGFAVGDVVGHDLTAAAAMARLQAALRIVAQYAAGPAHAIEELDRASRFIANSEMTTVGYADYDPATRRLRYACAGHPPPLLITDSGSEFLWSGRSMPVGMEPAARKQAECVVPAGATLVWYTDGLVERRGEPILPALERLAAAAARLSRQDADDLCAALLRHMLAGQALRDDTVVLCVRFTPVRGAAVAVAARTAPMAG